MTDITDRVRIHDIQTVSKRKYELKVVDLEWRRSDGSWQQMTREVYDKGNGATVLLYNLAQKTVVLIRQFRLPAFLNGYPQGLIEVAAGMLEGADPATRIRAEIEEETGYTIHHVTKVFEAFMSPGSMTEILHFFTAEYEVAARTGAGGGLADEGEDIEVMEVPFAEAIAMMKDGRIRDAKTIMLLQYAQLHVFTAD